MLYYNFPLCPATANDTAAHAWCEQQWRVGAGVALRIQRPLDVFCCRSCASCVFCWCWVVGSATTACSAQQQQRIQPVQSACTAGHGAWFRQQWYLGLCMAVKNKSSGAAVCAAGDVPPPLQTLEYAACNHCTSPQPLCLSLLGPFCSLDLQTSAVPTTSTAFSRAYGRPSQRPSPSSLCCRWFHR